MLLNNGLRILLYGYVLHTDKNQAFQSTMKLKEREEGKSKHKYKRITYRTEKNGESFTIRQPGGNVSGR
jgi:hypothetical protein